MSKPRKIIGYAVVYHSRPEAKGVDTFAKAPDNSVLFEQVDFVDSLDKASIVSKGDAETIARNFPQADDGHEAAQVRPVGLDTKLILED